MKKSLSLLVLLAVLLSGCASMFKPAVEDNIHVTVSIPPQAWLVQRIAGGLVQVQSLAEPGDDPHTYEPSPQQMAQLAGSDLYLSIGVEFEEAWLPRLANTNRAMKVVDITSGIQWLSMEHEHHDDHEGEEGHADGEAVSQPRETVPGWYSTEHKDPHIWLAPGTLSILASNTAEALINFNPENKAEYQAKLQALQKEIDTTAAELEALFKQSSGRHFLIVHPSLGYLAHEFGLEQIPVETGGLEPGPDSLAQLIAAARDLGVKAIFVQKDVDPKLARSIAEQLGIETLIEVDPLAANVLANIGLIGRQLAEVLR